MTTFPMAGADPQQYAGGSQFLDAMAARRPRTWQEVMAALPTPGGDNGAAPAAVLDMAQRLHNAARTPSGEPQPPEVAGIDASPRVPNQMQPESGEYDDGRLVRDSKPSFFRPGMPPPTGTTNNVGVPRADRPDAPPARHAAFGAPTGMVVPRGTGSAASTLALAALPPRPQPALPPNYDLAALPHFADGGALPAGGTGIVGEDGEEEIHASPAGGVTVTPLAKAPSASNVDPAALPRPNRGTAALAALEPKPEDPVLALAALEPRPRVATSPAPAPTELTPVAEAPLTARAQRELSGYGTDIAAPPEEQDAKDDYLKALRVEQAQKPPDPNDPRYKPSWWRKIAAVGLGALAGATQGNGKAAERVGAEVGNIFLPNRYGADEARYERQRADEQKQLGDLYKGVQAENASNADAERVWQADHANRRAQAAADQTADYRQEVLQQDAQNAAATAAYRKQDLDLRKQSLARHPQTKLIAQDGTTYFRDDVTGDITPATYQGQPIRSYERPVAPKKPEQPRAADVHAERLAAFDGKISHAPNLKAAQDYVRKNFASFAAAGITPAEIKAALGNYFPQQDALTGALGNQ